MLDFITQFIINNPVITLIGTVTLIQIVPIKLDPWSMLLNTISEALVGDMRKDLAEVKTDLERESVDNKRWNILDFANSCRNGRMHTKEEWNHVLEQLKQYETFCREKNIDNGVIEEETKYLRELYHDRNIKNDFL